jgi:hypothetical protein
MKMTATGSPEFAAFQRLLLELDGSVSEQRLEVTLACVEALVDRLACPPMLNNETPTPEDVDGAEAELCRMINEEANKVRAFIRSREGRV